MLIFSHTSKIYWYFYILNITPPQDDKNFIMLKSVSKEEAGEGSVRLVYSEMNVCCGGI